MPIPVFLTPSAVTAKQAGAQAALTNRCFNLTSVLASQAEQAPSYCGVPRPARTLACPLLWALRASQRRAPVAGSRQHRVPVQHMCTSSIGPLVLLASSGS